MPAFDFQHEKFSTQLGAVVSLNDRPNLATVSLNVHPVDRVYFGGAGKFKFSDKDTKITGEGRVAYVAPEFSAHVAVVYDKNRVPDAKDTRDENKVFGKNTLRLGYGFWHQYNRQLAVASTGTVDLSHPGGKGPEVNVGAAYEVDSNLSLNGKTKIAFTSGKETEIRLTLGSTTNLTPNVSATIGMDLNVQKLRGSTEAKDDHSCGVEFKFKQ